MGKRIISIIVIISLCVSTFVGALRLSLRFAKAQYDIQGYSIEQLLDLIEENYNTSVNASVYQTVYDRISALNVNGSGLICVAINGTSFSCSYWEEKIITGITNGPYAVDGVWYFTTNNGRAYYTYNVRPVFNICGGFGDQTNKPRLHYDQYANNSSLDVRNMNLDDSVFNTYSATAFPSTSNLNNASWNLYFSKDIYSSNDVNVISYEANLFEDPPEPEEVEFQVKSFWLGERQYITVVDQYLMYSMIDYNNEGQVLKSFRGEFYTENSSVSLYLPYEDTVLIEGGGNFIDGLSNVSAAGVYAWDITNLGYISLHEMFMYYHVDGGSGDVYAGYCTNCPYDLVADEPGNYGQPDSYTNSWTIFNDYITNYNSTHVIPDNLVDSIFGVNGFKIYPCDVQIPTNCWTGVSVAGYHTFKYHMAGATDLGLNYDLMDVVIVPQSEFGKYGLVYFYDDSLQTPYVFVDFIDYKDLLEQFDIIIIVDDTGHCLEENAWWQQIISSIVWDWADYMAVSGSSSNGISYSDDALIDNVEQGYAIVTKRAIQRQQLYVFNDGISKTYKLMSDYIDKRGDWEDSFLVWTSGLFSQWQTLDGRLSNIYSLLYDLNLSDWMDDISTKLDTLIDNTSPDIPEGDVWYTSLWNWILQFKPTNENFINSLQVYDDNWDQIPQISAAPSVPLIPTIGG